MGECQSSALGFSAGLSWTPAEGRSFGVGFGSGLGDGFGEGFGGTLDFAAGLSGAPAEGLGLGSGDGGRVNTGHEGGETKGCEILHGIRWWCGVDGLCV